MDVVQCKFRGQTRLQGSPKAFNPAFCLRDGRCNDSNPQLLTTASELCLDIFVDGSVSVCSFSVFEDCPVVRVEGFRNAILEQNRPQHVVVAIQRLLFVEVQSHGGSRSIVDGTVQCCLGGIGAKPIVRRSVNLKELSEVLFPWTCRMNVGRFPCTLSFRRFESGLGKDPVKRLIADPDMLDLIQFLKEMLEIEALVFLAVQLDNHLLQVKGGFPGSFLSFVAMCKATSTDLSILVLQSVQILSGDAKLCSSFPC